MYIRHDRERDFFKLNISDFADDVLNGTADVTLGDAWLPEYTKDYMENNILIMRNEQNNQLVKITLKNQG